MEQALKEKDQFESGDFLLALTEADYRVVMHALVVAGTTIESTKGADTSLLYDDLHDRLMDWNHCDEEPYIESQDFDVWLCSTCGYTRFGGDLFDHSSCC